MTAIGNDIVDLNCVSDSSKYIDRLLKYAFRTSEINYLVDTEKSISSWIFWSLKEASYKSAVKLGLQDRFSPKNFEVEITSLNRTQIKSVVKFDGHHFFGSSDSQDKFIFSNTSKSKSITNFYSEVFPTKDDYQSQSELIRLELLNNLERKLNLKHLSVTKNEELIPIIIDRNSNIIDIDLSLSHHGNFTSFSYSW